MVLVIIINGFGYYLMVLIIVISCFICLCCYVFKKTPSPKFSDIGGKCIISTSDTKQLNETKEFCTTFDCKGPTKGLKTGSVLSLNSTNNL